MYLYDIEVSETLSNVAACEMHLDETDAHECIEIAMYIELVHAEGLPAVHKLKYLQGLLHPVLVLVLIVLWSCVCFE